MTAGGGTGVHTMNDESGPSRSDIRNYPLRCWWVAARSEEVGRSMLARWLLDTPVLLFRTLAGDAVAIENRCPIGPPRYRSGAWRAMKSYAAITAFNTTPAVGVARFRASRTCRRPLASVAFRSSKGRRSYGSTWGIERAWRRSPSLRDWIGLKIRNLPTLPAT